jgi:hypothetical protein
MTMGWAPTPLDPAGDGRGSEGGRILIDEDYDDCARITLECAAGSAPFAITCGVYGWMVHTRFFGEEAEALAAYEAMKTALAAILEAIPLRTDPECDAKCARVHEAISAFIDAYP